MDLLEELLPGLLNSWLFPLITTIITSLITYHATKSVTKNSRMLEIKQKSFDNVYLPLNRIISKYPKTSLSHADSIRFYYKLYVITERNYKYTNPILIKLLRELKKLLDNNKYTEEKLVKIHQHISKEEYKLRKFLNYPTANFIQSFGSLNLNEKISTLFLIALCSTGFGIYIYSLTDKSTILNTFSLYWIGLSFLLTIIFLMLGILFILLDFIIRKIKNKFFIHQ
jgi:hypothetical protein